jgi:amino acid permease
MRHTALIGEHGLTNFTGVLAIISTIIGGGIVSIPYSFISFGIPIAATFQVLAVLMTIGSVHMYLWAKDVIPEKPESLYEIGYYTMERTAVFFVSIIQFINGFGLMMVYFIVFGDTAAQLFVNILNDGNPGDQPWFNRWFYVVVLGLLMTPIILKKELAELEWLSLLLFISLGVFVILMIWLLCFDSAFRDPLGPYTHGLTQDVYKPNHGIGRVISAVSVTFVAYGY